MDLCDHAILDLVLDLGYLLNSRVGTTDLDLLDAGVVPIQLLKLLHARVASVHVLNLLHARIGSVQLLFDIRAAKTFFLDDLGELTGLGARSDLVRIKHLGFYLDHFPHLLWLLSELQIILLLLPLSIWLQLSLIQRLTHQALRVHQLAALHLDRKLSVALLFDGSEQSVGQLPCSPWRVHLNDV